jgi:predicted RNase H-like HicB family nuclease
MARYKVIIFWSEKDEAFIARIPKLAGCMADGATVEDAIASAQLAVQEWIEAAQRLGRPIPEPEDN